MKILKLQNTLSDKNILTTFLTQHSDYQYGSDDIECDDGNLYVGNFDEGTVHKITIDGNGDGIVKDDKSNILCC